ncbi:HNH endonuclease [Lysinibacillus sp. NPDC097231]|uniref:HNH endonuclease n=1 Tax=Lysinibacillus sp. NPDC097231 TaxID=3364142 RepID=UPI0037F9B010
MLKDIGKNIGKLVDSTISGAGSLASKGVVKAGFPQVADFIDETASLVGRASNASIAMTGQAMQGVYQTAKGQLTKDTIERDEGVDELKDAGRRVVRGIGQTIKMGTTNTYETGAGLLTKDYERAKNGALNLAQMGIVAFTAVSIIDIVGEADVVEAQEIQAINADLEGDVHPITGVPFEINNIEYNGQIIQDVFPVFDSQYNANIPENMYLASDEVHFRLANEQLAQELEADFRLANQMGLSQTDIQGLSNNITPEGYIWHHHEQPGVLQLVNEDEHNSTAHTGGRFIWGGGSEYR